MKPDFSPPHASAAERASHRPDRGIPRPEKEPEIPRRLPPPHGGVNPGATYNGRQEKDDALRLTLAVGRLLENAGMNVVYTRTSDIYDSPTRKAEKANEAGGNYFISLHRNSSIYPNQYTGIESIVYNRYGTDSRMAENINENLQALGFVNQGVIERTNLVVLNRTQMPAVLVEVGFINNDSDNAIFDSRFDELAQAIADGILNSLPTG